MRRESIADLPHLGHPVIALTSWRCRNSATVPSSKMLDDWCIVAPSHKDRSVQQTSKCRGTETMSSDQLEQTEAAATIMRLMNGAWIARIVHTAAEIGVVDHLDDQPRDAQWVAAASGTHAPSLARLLRALAALGIVQETDQLQYTLTPLGAALRADAPGSMRGWARMILSEMDERPWQALTHAVRTGDYAFRHAFGTDAWSYRAAHPDNSRLFDEAMRSMTESVNAAVATSYPFKEFGWIVDVGGGNGRCCSRSWRRTRKPVARSMNCRTWLRTHGSEWLPRMSVFVAT
jgi:hypothetical protein